LNRESLLILALVVTVGCTRRVDALPAQELVGSWHLPDESLTVLRNAGFQKSDPSDHRIYLRADGRCEFKSYWEFHLNSPEKERDYHEDNTSCKWATVDVIVDAFSSRKLLGRVEITVTSAAKGNPPLMTSGVDLTAEQRGDEIVLVASGGDPDKTQRIFYARDGSR
jgi:hypothetical protein